MEVGWGHSAIKRWSLRLGVGAFWSWGTRVNRNKLGGGLGCWPSGKYLLFLAA